MANDDAKEVIEEVGQALQVALLLATRARQVANERADESRQLEEAVKQASTAIKRLTGDSRG
jgi:hypothetical protein